MRLKSQPATNQRIKTCVTHIFFLCVLTANVVVNAATPRQQTRPGFARQLYNKSKVNNVDDSLQTNSYHQPHFTGNRSVIVQLFEWKFFDIAEECRLFLGPQGYAGVQLSPVLEHTVVQTSELNHPWWERYEVISYRLASRSGDESEFWSMSRICNDNGVRIYADVVLNHMAAPLHLLTDSEMTNKDFIVNTLLESQVNISNMNYSNVTYTQQDFHRPCAMAENTQDAHEIRNCQLNGHPDLDHSHSAVQQHIVEMLNKFIDMGVAGFRIDSAKYIWPIDLKNIYGQVKDLNQDFGFKENTKPFFYYDVFDMGLDTVSKTEYATYGVVSEYLYPAVLSTIFNGKSPLSSFINWGPAMGFLAHQDSLVFVDSHDTQRGLPNELGGNHMLTHKQRIKYIMANAFMLAHPYGNIKRIMSSYYYAANDINQGPPVEKKDVDNDDDDGDNQAVIRSPKFNAQQQCTHESGWVCEHRWPSVVNMVKLANYLQAPGQQEESVVHFQTNGPNQIAFCRGLKAFVAINNEPDTDFTKEVYACLEPGIYCDIITGGKKENGRACHGRQLEINEQGYAKLVVPVADADADTEDYGDGENEIGEEVGEEEAGKVESYGILVVYVESKIEIKEGEDQGEIDNNIDASEAGDLENKENEVPVTEITNNEAENDENLTDDKDKENNSNQLEEDNEVAAKDPPADSNEDHNQENDDDNEIDKENSEDRLQDDNPETMEEGKNPEEDTNNAENISVNENANDNEINASNEDNADQTKSESEDATEPEDDNQETVAENVPEEDNIEIQPDEIEEEAQANEQPDNNAEEKVDSKQLVEETNEGNEGPTDQEENPEEKDAVKEIPEEKEQQGENSKEEQETAEAATEKLTQEISENVVEKPESSELNESENTAELVNDIKEASVGASTNVQDIQKAGIFSASNNGGNNI